MTSILERRLEPRFQPNFLVPGPSCRGRRAGLPLYIGQMICFCAERFHWRRIWQNPGELLLPGLTDMATRALLYRRPAEPSTLLVRHGSQFFAIRLRRHRRARRYTLRIHPTDREAILTMPPRGTLGEAKEFAQLHGGWIAARLGRLPKAAPFQTGTVVPLRGVAHRIVHRAGERGTVWTETRDSGEKILCVAGGVELYRPSGPRLPEARGAQGFAEVGARPTPRRSGSGSSGCRSAISRAAGVHAPRRARCRFPGG